jgi:hypothetical protein
VNQRLPGPHFHFISSRFRTLLIDVRESNLNSSESVKSGGFMKAQVSGILAMAAIVFSSCGASTDELAQLGNKEASTQVRCPEARVMAGEVATQVLEEDCGGGGGSGGGSGGGTPTSTSGQPLTAPDVSGSYLNASARQYLTQAGFASADQVGATMWVEGCKTQAAQGGFSFDSGSAWVPCSWANTYAGWIIIGTDYDVIENLHNRGSATVSAINGPTTINVSEMGSKFKLAAELALKAKDIEAKGKIDLEYQRMKQYEFKFDGTGNQLTAAVKANGGLFRKSLIKIVAKAKLLRIY